MLCMVLRVGQAPIITCLLELNYFVRVTSWWILKHGGGDIFHNRPKTPQSLIELYETIYNTDLEAEVNSINDLSPSGRIVLLVKLIVVC